MEHIGVLVQEGGGCMIERAQTDFTNFCGRCNRRTSTTTMSLFNTDMCCNSCIEMERDHPSFPEARKAELDELQKGNYNYPGIGLPADLQP